jgi:hypothetical protein
MASPDSEMRVRIGGKRWNLVRKAIKHKTAEGHKIYGYCDPPCTKSKRIVVDKHLNGEVELETFLHELLHASCWPLLDETFVNDTAVDLARILYRIGYRKTSSKGTE